MTSPSSAVGGTREAWLFLTPSRCTTEGFFRRHAQAQICPRPGPEVSTLQMSRLHKIYLGNFLYDHHYSLCSHPSTTMFSGFVTWSFSQTNLEGSYYALYPRSLITPYPGKLRATWPYRPLKQPVVASPIGRLAQISKRSKATSDLTCCQNTTAAFSRVRTLDKNISRQLFQVRQQCLPNCWFGWGTKVYEPKTAL